jgi:hypothetical protein
MPLPTNNLQAIEQKVRKLTRSPSTAQLSALDLDNYINTFILYDFPEHLRTFKLKTSFTFYTNPYQDEYPTDILSFGTASSADLQPLYNFQNLYLTIHPPLFIAGFEQFYTQSREELFAIYPKVNFILGTGFIGDGIQTTFSGVIRNANQPPFSNPPYVQQQSTVLLKNQVLFDSVDINNNGLSLIDVPCLDPVTGNQTVWGNLYIPGQQPATAPLPPGTPPMIISYTPLPGNTVPNGVQQTNYINYLTGAYTITFNIAPRAGAPINSQTVPSVTALPQAVCFYANKFIVRPVPDQPYRINFEVYARPTALLASGDIPQLEEYWQLFAYGAAKKVFEDRMDLESVALILPEYKKQMALVERRTIVQITNSRSRTIYTDQLSGGYNNFWGGGPF